ncbi:MAG TPA: tripartite tricarboxylate transporter substrate binding protein [Burkholderiales bacterium]|nr:tripartite tricarboxylate transporter substrate binding protein [Burkholderiales bacterium]
MAQSYPSKAIRMIVPFPPGGGNDIIGRLLAQRIGESLGQQVIVDNRGGAGSTLGTDLTAKAPPDGHTLLITNIALAVNATLYPKLPYDTLRDLTAVTQIGWQPNVLVVHPSMPAKSLRDLLALARARPGELIYGSGGVGSAGHLATELLRMMTRVQMVHVPYKGLGPALTDLAGGHVLILISTVASAMPHVKSGRIRALAVTTLHRSAVLPQVPTMNEAGASGYEFSTWYGLFVPSATPRAIIDRLNRETAKALSTPDLKEQFAAQGIEGSPTSAEAFSAYVRNEVAKWGKVVKASGAKVE